MSRVQQQLRISIQEETQAGEARRSAARLASEVLRFDETDAGRVALVATELARNLFRHAQGGELLLRAINEDGSQAMELLSIDAGPGMADLGACMRDGYSTAGTPGTGMGAVARLSDYLDIYSVPNQGTVLVSQIWGKSYAPRPSYIEYGVVNIPVQGETACGDSFAVQESDGRCLVMVADGLGHGEDAAKASLQAVRILGENLNQSPCEILDVAHAALRSTRGAAASVAEIAVSSSEVRYAGIGNISGSILIGAASRSMVSHNGTLGHAMRKCQVFVYPWSPGSVLVMHSDGLTTHWDLRKYPGITDRHPAVMAGVIYRDFKRGRDDVTVLVARERRISS